MGRVVGLQIQDKKKKPTKKEVCEKLVELGIEFDGKAKLEELLPLLPEGSLDE